MAAVDPGTKSSTPSLWRLDTKAQSAAASVPPRAFRWVGEAALPLSLTLMAIIAVLLPLGLDTAARLNILAFSVAAILWATTHLNAAYVGLASVLFLVLTGAVPQKELFGALASDIIWLMIGAFVVAGALRETGLATRMTQLVVRRATTVGGALWALTVAVVPLAMFIPSTSGRAAMLLPVFHNLSDTIKDKRCIRAMALLIPSIILVSTIMSLIAAGSHLIANDMLASSTGQSISFARWAAFGVPFGIAASIVTCWIVAVMFLDKRERSLPLPVQRSPNRRLTWNERTAMVVVIGMVGLWMTQSLHGLEAATVTVAGAVVLCTPKLGVISWHNGLKAVSWNLVIFVGAALVLGRALIQSDVTGQVVEILFQRGGLGTSSSTHMVLIVISAICLTSHIFMPSHAARAAAMVPPLLYLAQSLQLDPVAVVLVGNVGINYCLTFPVSSKALLVYQELDVETFSPADLMRLSAVLLPVHLVLTVVFYYGFWRWAGFAF